MRNLLDVSSRAPAHLLLIAAGAVATAGALAAPAMARTSPAPPPSQATTRQYDALLAEALSQEDAGAAMARVVMLPRLRLYVPTTHASAQLERAIAETTHPQVRVALERQLEQARRELGDWSGGAAGMQGRVGEQGCLTDFMMVGPFSNDSMEGFFSRLPPELGESGPYAGKAQEVDWRPLPPFSEMCTLNVDVATDPDDQAVVYLAHDLEAPAGRPARLLVGAAGHYQVWLNGELVGWREDQRGLFQDADAWPVELDAGKNHLLIKLASSQSSGLDLSARIVGEDLEPLADVTTRAEWAGEPVAAPAEVDPKPAPGPSGVLAQAKALAGGEPGRGALWGAWLWSAAGRRDAATPWRDVAARIDQASREGALELGPTDYILLAELFEEHFERLAILERGRAAHPDDPWVAFNLAEEYQKSLNESRQLARRALLEQIVEAHPDFAPAYVELAGWWQQAGFDVRALEMMRQGATDDRMTLPAYGMRLLGLLESNGSEAQANELRDELAATASISVSDTWHDVQQATARGQLEEALELVTTYRSRYPWSRSWLIKHVDLLRATGRPEDALAELEARLDYAPADVRIWRKRAEVLMGMSRHEDAAEALEQALEIRPQDSEMRDLIAHLRPGVGSLPRALDARRLRELSPARPTPSPFHPPRSSTSRGARGPQRARPAGRSARHARQRQRGHRRAAVTRVSFQTGDERVEVLRVRIYKPDGTISEDYDSWNSGGSRKGSTTYNDTGYLNMRANNVEVGDIVEFRWRTSQVSNHNFRGDYFGDISYMQGTQPIAFERYAVLYPKDWKLYFRAPKIEHRRQENFVPGDRSLPDGFRSTVFTLENVPEVQTDPGQPGATDVYDYLLVSNKKTWDEIGEWWWQLVKEQLIVNEEIREKVAELTKGLEKDRSQARGDS